MLPAHDAPQGVPGAGYAQAPLALQSLVPHTPALTHVVAAAQQCVPEPAVPHLLLRHCALVEQAPPSLSLQALAWHE
jgi:hypothetical protein